MKMHLAAQPPCQLPPMSVEYALAAKANAGRRGANLLWVIAFFEDCWVEGGVYSP